MSESRIQLRSLPPRGENKSHTAMLGTSAVFLRMIAKLKEAADWNCEPVLLIGERGAGKELAAQALHRWSVRHNKTFLPIFIPALCENLLADELFGHERHSFSGALTSRLGRFAAAEEGTIFLDEIGDLSHAAQVSLLRILETGEITPIGEDMPRQIDVRIVVATNRNLPELIRQGLFRADLYDRLRVFHIRVPPLRDRREDIPLLASHFLKQAGGKMGCAIRQGKCIGCAGEPVAKCASQCFYRQLQTNDWEGNVRDLRTVIIRARSAHPHVLLDASHADASMELDSAPAGIGTASACEDFSLQAAMEKAMRNHIQKVLTVTKHNLAATAKKLGIPPSTLRDNMKKVGLTR